VLRLAAPRNERSRSRRICRKAGGEGAKTGGAKQCLYWLSGQRQPGVTGEGGEEQVDVEATVTVGWSDCDGAPWPFVPTLRVDSGVGAR
jgi:hypothetical protein